MCVAVLEASQRGALYRERTKLEQQIVGVRGRESRGDGGSDKGVNVFAVH